MNFLELLKIEFMKVRRSKIVPLLFIAPLLVVASGVASLSRYFTPEYTNAWPAMFIQSALVYAYYLLPFSMIVVCVMIAGQETAHNGILKMLALPVSRYALSIAKFCVLAFFLFMEMAVFLAVFVIAGLLATHTMGVEETLPILYLLKWCGRIVFYHAALYGSHVGYYRTVRETASFRGAEFPACDSRYIGCEYASVDPFTPTVTAVISYPALSTTLQPKLPAPRFRCSRFYPARSWYSVCFFALAVTRFGKKEMG